jgi:hypothetical protein
VKDDESIRKRRSSGDANGKSNVAGDSAGSFHRHRLTGRRSTSQPETLGSLTITEGYSQAPPFQGLTKISAASSPGRGILANGEYVPNDGNYRLCAGGGDYRLFGGICGMGLEEPHQMTPQHP